jgi:hypothetical protein
MGDHPELVDRFSTQTVEKPVDKSPLPGRYGVLIERSLVF